MIEPWPDNVWFEDAPDAVAEPFNEANAYRNGLRYARTRTEAQSSMGERQL